MTQQLFIIRWSGPVLFRSGTRSNMCSYTGTREGAETYARKLAMENNVSVESIF